MSRLPSTMNTSSCIVGNVRGKTTIQFDDDSNAKTFGFVDSLFCRFGWVHHGDVMYSVKVTVLSFDSCGDSGLILCDNLNSLCSPHVMHVYACVEGTHETYLALQYFDKTFSSFIEDERSQMIANHGRFANAFIEVSRDIIKGLLSLHSKGFCCPELTGKHVAILSEDGHLRAKIWNFSEAENEEEMNGDWLGLADMIEKAARKHGIFYDEVSDLCERMKKGELKGLEILKHSSMLPSPEKQNQLLALCGYAQTYCVPPYQENPFVDDPAKSQIHNDLVEFLDDCSVELSKSMPQWIKDVNDIRFASAVVPTVHSPGQLLYEIRSMFEHGDEYLPPRDPSKPELARPDLQSEFWEAWEQELTKFHKFAVELELEY